MISTTVPVTASTHRLRTAKAHRYGTTWSYCDVSTAARAVSWSDRGAYVRDEVAEHVRDLSPEVAMSLCTHVISELREEEHERGKGAEVRTG